MSDFEKLINASDLIEWIMETDPDWCVGIVRSIVDHINEMPSAQPEQKWIPCKKRPPKEGRDVLITKEPFKIKGYEHEVIKAKRSVDPRSGKIEWWSPEFGALTNKAVLAWMPLPKPYKKEEWDG